MNKNRYFGYRSFEPEYETMKEMRKRGIDTVTIMVSNNTNFMGAPYTRYQRPGSGTGNMISRCSTKISKM